MEEIFLLEPEMKYAEDIWKFRREIFECDAETEDQFAGCISLDTSNSAEEWIQICQLRKNEETCNVHNEASEKTILANGGVFEKIIDVDGSKIKRYWITV